MTALPFDDQDPDDPVETLEILPAQYRAQFLDEYEAAVGEARHPEHFRSLHDLLRLWRLRALTYSDSSSTSRPAS
jgi:hypothetical protein